MVRPNGPSCQVPIAGEDHPPNKKSFKVKGDPFDEVDIGQIVPYYDLSSGIRSQFAAENGPVEIVDLPIKQAQFCKRLPEGT